jgi:hypothetical protein
MLHKFIALFLGIVSLSGCGPKKTEFTNPTSKTEVTLPKAESPPKANRTPVQYTATELLKHNKTSISYLFDTHAQDIVEVTGIVHHLNSDFRRNDVEIYLQLATDSPKEQLPCPLGVIKTNPYDQVSIGQKVLLRADMSQFDSFGTKPFQYEIVKAESGDKPLVFTMEELAKRLGKLADGKSDEALIGKAVSITGKITGYQGGGASGAVYVEMKTPENPVSVICYMLFPNKSGPASDPERYGKTGDVVTVLGKVASNSNDRLELDYCVLAKPK